MKIYMCFNNNLIMEGGGEGGIEREREREGGGEGGREKEREMNSFHPTCSCKASSIAVVSVSGALGALWGGVSSCKSLPCENRTRPLPPIHN